VSLHGLKRVLAVGLLIGGTLATIASGAAAQEESGRKAKSKVVPAYPELARRMRIAGVVKVQVRVGPDGAVKDTRVLGGHPVLAGAVLDAVRKWKFEARSQETTENLQFRFDPSE